MSSTTAPSSHSLHSKPAAQILSVIGIICGVLCLLAGVGVIFTWAFLPEFARLHPVGLRAGAVISTLGACFLLLSVISLCFWQRLLKRAASRIRSSLSSQNQDAVRKSGNICQFQLPDNQTTEETKERKRLGSLKKASSTAYISLNSLQSEKLKLVGVIQGTISTTELNRPIGASNASQDGVLSSASVPTRSATILFHSDTKPLFARNVSANKQPFTRDKYLRRSLPRVLIQTPNEKVTRNGGSTQSERLSKAKSEGVKLDSFNRRNRVSESRACEVNANQSDANTTAAVTEAASTCLNRVSTTPPVGQASLFNLDHNGTSPTMFGANATLNDSISSPFKAKQSSRNSLDRSGKRLLLMNQSGEVISCTTLFDGEEVDDEFGSAGANIGCRRLQACAGWNFFPLFVQTDTHDDSIRSDEQDQTNRIATHSTQSCNDPENFVAINCSKDQQSTKHESNETLQLKHSRWFIRIRKFLRGQLKRAKQLVTPVRNDITCEEAHSMLLSRSNDEVRTEQMGQSRAGMVRMSTEKALRATGDESAQPNGLDDLTDTEDVKNRKQTVISNASVFSLPAIAPELWTVERPVWIMGVPVDDQHWLALDAYDLIFMEEGRAGSMDSIKHVTGSTSSIFAFHVRPPSRLKPTTRISKLRCGRARSLGRILISEKQSSQPP